jgi:hypothetical protein
VGIRTPDPLLPKQVLYQAELRPDISVTFDRVQAQTLADYVAPGQEQQFAQGQIFRTHRKLLCESDAITGAAALVQGNFWSIKIASPRDARIPCEKGGPCAALFGEMRVTDDIAGLNS